MLSRLYSSWRKRLFRSPLLATRTRTLRRRGPVVELLEDRFLPSFSLNIME